MIDPDGSLAELRAICGMTSGLLKTESDLARYEWIIHNCGVDVVIETGLAYGGSARWFAERVMHVISVEENIGYIADVLAEGLPDNVWGVPGDSVDAATVAEVAEDLDELLWIAELAQRDLVVMVSLDSAHGAQHVLKEIEAYKNFVSPGCYLVVEDGTFDLMPEEERRRAWVEGSPLDAVCLFLARGQDEFRPDMQLEDMFPTTQHMGGWLRRRTGCQ